MADVGKEHRSDVCNCVMCKRGRAEKPKRPPRLPICSIVCERGKRARCVCGGTLQGKDHNDLRDLVARQKEWFGQDCESLQRRATELIASRPTKDFQAPCSK